MQKIEIYKADDGTLLATKEECEVYEKFLYHINEVEKFIKKGTPQGVQNSIEDVENFFKCFRGLLELYAPSLINYWDNNKHGIIGRFLSDSDNPIYEKLNKLYQHGVLCVGADLKSYDQPYNALRSCTITQTIN